MADAARRRVGALIAAQRNRLKLSQEAFGERIGRSASWVGQVERGARSIDRMSVLEKISEMAGIPLADLLPVATVEKSAQGADAPPAVSDLALALVASSPLRFQLGDRPAESSSGDRPDPAGLIEDASRAWDLVHGSSYDEVGEQLLDLLPQLEDAVRGATGAQQKALYAALATAYHAAAAVLSKLGDFPSAWVAADRAIERAASSGDALLMAAGAFRLTIVFQSGRSLEMAQRTAEDADEALAALGEADDPRVASLRGALNLQLAVIASRHGDADKAYTRLALARQLAEQNGQDRNDLGTEFGPTNVGMHEVAIALELGDAGRALRVGDALDASGLSAERQARLLIDLARAHEQRRNLAGVIAALTAAEELAPQQVRAHPRVRTLLEDLGETPAANDSEFADLKEHLLG